MAASAPFLPWLPIVDSIGDLVLLCGGSVTFCTPLAPPSHSHVGYSMRDLPDCYPASLAIVDGLVEGMWLGATALG